MSAVLYSAILDRAPGHATVYVCDAIEIARGNVETLQAKARKFNEGSRLPVLVTDMRNACEFYHEGAWNYAEVASWQDRERVA